MKIIDFSWFFHILIVFYLRDYLEPDNKLGIWDYLRATLVMMVQTRDSRGQAAGAQVMRQMGYFLFLAILPYEPPYNYS